MDYICIVQVLDRLAQAVEYSLNVHKVEVDGRPDNLLKIALHVLHYYVESREVMLIFRFKYLFTSVIPAIFAYSMLQFWFRAFPANAALFVGYELSRELMGK